MFYIQTLLNITPMKPETNKFEYFLSSDPELQKMFECDNLCIEFLANTVISEEVLNKIYKAKKFKMINIIILLNYENCSVLLRNIIQMMKTKVKIIISMRPTTLRSNSSFMKY